MNSLRINEIFYSIQGEGARAGKPSIFIRTSGCSMKHACYMAGITCDTEFDGGREISAEEILEHVTKLNVPCRDIVWTGGEPTDQLTVEHVVFFKEAGYYQCIETSGVRPVPHGLDFVSISPKVNDYVLTKNFPEYTRGADISKRPPEVELRYVVHSGKELPVTELLVNHLFLSPHFDGDEPNLANIRYCIKMCLRNPMYRLSIQGHKLLQIL